MKVAILSRNSALYSTNRLLEACRRNGHQADVLDPLKFSIFVEQECPRLYYDGLPIGHYDAVIPRIGSSITFFGTAVVRQFELMGVFCLNTARAIVNARDKLRAIQILSRHNIGLPKTAFIKQRSSVAQAIESVGGAPVIIKLLEGTQGIGVILADTNKTAEAIIETLHSTKQNVLIQKFIAESKGQDIRALVVGGRVVAAMRRSADGDEFRSNVHRGAKIESIQLDAAYETSAIHAAHILGLNVAGVDMLESSEGPKVMEVNSSPGLQGIEQATGIDIAQEIIGYLEEEILFPEYDIRQRLTLKTGYGVVEIPIADQSFLSYKSIHESHMLDLDIRVLSIMRGSLSIPNPIPSQTILPGDRLLCFGKIKTLKDIAHNRFALQNI